MAVKVCCFDSTIDELLLSCRVSELDKEIAVIALPALASLAADPIASLVDTAYIGRLGTVSLYIHQACMLNTFHSSTLLKARS